MQSQLHRPLQCAIHCYHGNRTACWGTPSNPKYVDKLQCKASIRKVQTYGCSYVSTHVFLASPSTSLVYKTQFQMQTNYYKAVALPIQKTDPLSFYAFRCLLNLRRNDSNRKWNSTCVQSIVLRVIRHRIVFVTALCWVTVIMSWYESEWSYCVCSTWCSFVH